MKKIAALSLAMIAGYANAYQMSNVTAPSYPVIIPSPMSWNYYNAS
jgi:hypothetical protein